MAKNSAAIARPNRKELDRWAELEQERLELARRTKAIKALQEPIEQKAQTWAEANADKTRVVMCCDFKLELCTKRASAKWKDEFVRVAGLDEAEAITAAQPTHQELKIHPPAAA